MQTTFHGDGTVTFWSVTEGRTVRESADTISAVELEALSPADRERVMIVALDLRLAARSTELE